MLTIVFLQESRREDEGVGFDLAHEELNAHEGDVNAVRFNPKDASVLCSVGDDGLVKIWRVGV